ncbi:TetR/AcrR family transcriptional regulator [Streptomyces hoynatensis]|uniref:TetR/AcrR family transcriptional regulator n=1 Tax=Streptomyces hoynatensis TaxID=1141874 RepID=A0A3A9YXH6_9ACTN|nr:TetR/AcrR family transcriptional regulator [Streptomyces hoynatensis]
MARRAGVGNATMYRHFPTRRELIIAVYSGEVAALCARSRSLLTEDPPADALFRPASGFPRTRWRPGENRRCRSPMTVRAGDRHGSTAGTARCTPPRPRC